MESVEPSLIVAIGASAGGIEAITDLLKNLSSNTGMAYFYLQHLDPTHESMLVPILERVTTMVVQEAADGIKIAPNRIYVLPPNKLMVIKDGTIKLEPRKAKPAINLPINHFFSSIAEVYKESSVGVLLSGNANDGTEGMKAIRLSGGITIVQDKSAKFASMPRSAMAEDVIDFVLSPEGIAKELERIGHQFEYVKKTFLGNETSILDNDEDLKTIIQIVKKSTGVDFTHYKMNTIKRRIIRRMLVHKLESLDAYIQFIRENASETNLLYGDLLINVTSFFRDLETTEYLKKFILPKIIKSKSTGEPIRIWVTACSTGEEAYSLAIIMHEILGLKATSTTVQIFATDLSETAIAKARLGIFSKEALVNVSPQRVQQFFTEGESGYRIAKSIRDMVVFAPHNIFKDPPFSRVDFISCCNLLIYLDNILQKKIIATFHYALLSTGHLMLGKSESISTSAELFSQTEKKYKLFTKRTGENAKALLDMSARLPDKDNYRTTTNGNGIPRAGNTLDKSVDNILLNLYTPACVVVNIDLEILHFKGSTGLFLEPSPGKASFNLLKMARAGLGYELRNAIIKSKKTGEVVIRSGIEIKDNGQLINVSIEIVPIQVDQDEKNFLVIFREMKHSTLDEKIAGLSKEQAYKKLQEELTAVKEDMRSIIEEQESTNEELQSANEEIVSSNEELKSINEELETSKEEIESSNEELITINTELQIRNEQLAESYLYAEAVFGTIREAVLVLDHELIIKSANPAFYRIFKMSDDDTLGRQIFELRNKEWDFPVLRNLLEESLAFKNSFEGVEITHNFENLGSKVLLLNAQKVMQKIHRKQLILFAIEDITEHRKAERLIAEREAWFRDMSNNAPAMILVMNVDREVDFLNKTYLEFTGKLKEEQQGKGWLLSLHQDDREALQAQLNKCLAEKIDVQGEYRMRRNDGEYRWIYFVARPHIRYDGMFMGLLVSGTEVHDQHVISEELEKRVGERTKDLASAVASLERSNSELKQFAYVASHDLQEPLRKIMSFSDRLQKLVTDMPDTGKNYLSKISQSADRMSRLIEDLLNFSRIANADKKFSKTDLNEIMNSVLSDFEVNKKRGGAQVTFDKLPVIKAIPLQMEQLFHNLISNGIKFSKKGDDAVLHVCANEPDAKTLSQYNLNQSSSYIELIFKDNGIGIEPQYVEQIFKIFQRLHGREEYPGTGIGLALCEKIVLNHEGHIFVESSGNGGSSFHVILPVEQKNRKI